VVSTCGSKGLVGSTYRATVLPGGENANTGSENVDRGAEVAEGG